MNNDELIEYQIYNKIEIDITAYEMKYLSNKQLTNGDLKSFINMTELETSIKHKNKLNRAKHRRKNYNNKYDELQYYKRKFRLVNKDIGVCCNCGKHRHYAKNNQTPIKRRI